MYTCKDMQYMNAYKINKAPVFMCLAPACISSDIFENLGCVLTGSFSSGNLVLNLLGYLAN